MRQSILLRSLAIIVVAAGAVCLYLVREHRVYPVLPYHDSFAEHRAGEWAPMGGYWSVNQDEMINRSDEPGAKLVTGSPLWTDYQVDVDLELRAHGGDAGMALRVNDPGLGINAYRGYYVGIRSVDSALVIGRARNDWLEGRPVPMSGGVQTGVWYHIRAAIVGCEIAMEATNLNVGQTAFAAFRDDPAECIHAGKIGLRSTDTSGAWKNLRVASASPADLERIAQHATFISRPEYPIQEGDYSRMRMEYFPDYPHLGVDGSGEVLRPGATPALVPVASLQTRGYIGEHVRILGLVTFTDPVFLQDSTGGVMLLISDPEQINIGDEVEVDGQAVAGGFSPVFSVNSVHLLRDRTSVSPVSVTPTEAATGAHAGALVEVTGVVNRKTTLGNGFIFLELADPTQKFAALLKGDLFNSGSQGWTPGATIRVRGICTMNPEAGSGRSFTILVPSASDVSVIAGPPWWSGWRLARTIALVLLLCTLGVYMLSRFEKSKHRAIVREREHLAHEMHDTLAQSFAGVGYYLQSIRKSLREVRELPVEVLDELNVACDMVTDTHREASASIAALHPDGDGAGDLLTMLERAAYSMLGGGRIPITLCREGSPRFISPTVSDALFHVGREAISNVLRHSGANEMTLSLRFQPGLISIAIGDDGSGFDLKAHGDGFGLQSMRRRCSAVSGELAVWTSPGNGCTITATAPTRGRSALGKWWRKVFLRG